MSRLTSLPALVCLLAFHVEAQVPETIHWQGYLTGEAGPLNGPVDLVIRLYEVKAGGTALYFKDTTGVVADEGVVHVPLTSLSDVQFDGPLFLGLEVNGGQELVPRSPLGGVPYALAVRGLRTRRAELEGFAGSVNVVLGASNNVMDADILGATISGGGGSIQTREYPNRVTGNFGTIGGGYGNTAGNTDAIGGGTGNQASGGAATIAGGAGNEASGFYATVPGGSLNDATGAASFAAGFRAKAVHDGSFVWADQSGVDFSSTSPNQFAIRANGGLILATTSTDSAHIYGTSRPGSDLWLHSNDDIGLVLNADNDDEFGVFFVQDNAGTYVFRVYDDGRVYVHSTLEHGSDRNRKHGIVPVDPAEILQRVNELPISRWIFNGEEATHLGPMAQDFHAAFGLGDDERSIATVDADGVALAAIQGLYGELLNERERNDALEHRVAELERSLSRLTDGLDR